MIKSCILQVLYQPPSLLCRKSLVTRIWSSFCSPVREIEPQILHPHVRVEVQQEMRTTAGYCDLSRVLVGGEEEGRVARPRPLAREEWSKEWRSLSIIYLGQAWTYITTWIVLASYPGRSKKKKQKKKHSPASTLHRELFLCWCQCYTSLMQLQQKPYCEALATPEGKRFIITVATTNQGASSLNQIME